MDKTVWKRAITWWLAHRWIALIVLASLTAALSASASRVKPDYAVEHFFPADGRAHDEYQRFRTAFPHEDATSALLYATGFDVHSILGELRALPSVATISPPLPSGVDPTTTVVRIILDPAHAGTAEGRRKFNEQATTIVSKLPSSARGLLTGVPVIRAQFAQLIEKDTGTLLPVALLVTLVILFAVFRRVGAVLAAVATVLVAIVWSLGALGLLGQSLTIMNSLLPIIVLIVSVSDSTHIVNDYLKPTTKRSEALVAAIAHNAGPCFATEVVIASGFLSLLAIGVSGIQEFAIGAAVSVFLAWLANVTVLPLALSLVKKPVEIQPNSGARSLGRVVDWIGTQTTQNWRRVVVIAALIVLAAGILGTRVERIAYTFDDLPADSEMYRQLEEAQARLGGLVPLAVFIEGQRPLEALGAEGLFASRRIAEILRGLDGVGPVVALADATLGSADGPDVAARARKILASQGLDTAVVSSDGASGAVQAWVKNLDSRRVAALLAALERQLLALQHDLERRGSSLRVYATGQLRLFHEVNQTLTGDLLMSLLWALLATFVVFCIVLRSVRLGLLGILPNLAPMVLALAFLALMGISIRPTTAVLFSIILVIADDDTIQYLSRLRGALRRNRDQADPHQAAAQETLRDAGVPMLTTAIAVGLGFSVLLLAKLQGTADLGAILSSTLFFAVFADLFLAPILVAKLRPKISK